MAIIEECPGVKAEVLVAQHPLREYDDDEEEKVPNVTTKYIESRSGEEFILKWTFCEPFRQKYGVKVGVQIDGDKLASRIYHPDELFRPTGHNKCGDGFKKDGQWYRRNYRFTALNIVEEIPNSSQVPALRRDVRTKGCISLTFYFTTNMIHNARPERGSATGYLQSMGDLPEKALKGDARSHQTTLGELYKIRPRLPGYKYDLVSTEPFATFHFKYRSKAALKALRIITDEDVEQTFPEDKPEDQMTTAELRETVRRMRRREEENRPVKQEGNVEARVKREREVETGNEDDDEVTIVETRQKRPRRDPEVIVLD